MPDFFQNKDYSDYFETLNRQLGDNTPKKESEPLQDKEKGYTQPQKSRGIYKTFRLNWKKLVGVVAILLVILLIIISSVKGCSKDTVEEKPQTISSQHQAIDQPEEKEVKKISYSVTDSTVNLPKTNDCKTGIIIRKSDNAIIAQRNMHKKIYPASTLKVMTLLVAAEHIENFDDTFTMTLDITDPLYVNDASVAGFLNGEVITMTDLLYGLILPSGADAAMGLAIKVAGSEEAFVDMMNQKAAEIGLTGTNFTNCTGLHHKNNYSTAYDMAIITDYAMQNELCRKVLSTYQHKTQKTEQNPKGILLQSTLFSYMYGTEPETAVILGGKTGFVNEAGYCITSFGENISKTEEYIVVTMGNSSRWPAFYGQIDLYKEFAK